MTTGGQTQFSNLKFFPLTYVVKYDPPMIGMVYKTSEKDTKKRIYKIYLHGLIYKNDADQITQQLFQEHALHINENVVSQKQIKNLVNKILQWRAKKTEGGDSHANKKTGVNAHRSDLINMDEGPNSQDFAKHKAGFQQQQGNKYAYQDEDDEENEYEGRGDNDNLEFDGEIEDLENDQGVFDYGNYGSRSQQKGPEKKLGGQAGFIKSLADKKAQEKPNDEMDFILDDPDNLDNFSDY